MKEFLYDWGGINIWLFHLINNIRFPYLDNVMLTGTALGSHQLFNLYMAVLSMIAVIAIAKTPTNYIHYRAHALLWISTVAVFSIAYFLDGLFLSILKPLLDFPRPPLALTAGSLYIIGLPEYHHSLPSGHSSFAMLMVASIWPLLIQWQKIIGILFVLWVGISRISLGAHFPADVLAGWLSSLIIVLLVRSIINNILRKGS